jgi:hypothetical protein
MVQREIHLGFACLFAKLITKRFLMDFFMKLPRGKREFVLFLLILSIISMNIIAPLITGFEMSFSLKTWYHTVSIMLFYGLVLTN